MIATFKGQFIKTKSEKVTFKNNGKEEIRQKNTVILLQDDETVKIVVKDDGLFSTLSKIKPFANVAVNAKIGQYNGNVYLNAISFQPL